MRPAITAMVVVLTAACTLRAADPLAESSLESDRDSPHGAVSIHVFVTPDGEVPLRQGAADYPVGTILLKQKLIASATELYTGMLKREPGYNPECGDWEFFTLSGDARRVTARGRIDSCMACHLEYEETGFVARDYVIDNRPRRTVAARPANEIVQAEREGRDADLAAIARDRFSTMIRVTEEQFYDLDPAVIADCVHPSEVRRQLQEQGVQFSDRPGGPEEHNIGFVGFTYQVNDEPLIPRILAVDPQSGLIVAPLELPNSADETIPQREERIFVTSNSQIDIEPPQEFLRPLLPPPGVTSEFFGTIGEVPAFAPEQEIAFLMAASSEQSSIYRLAHEDQFNNRSDGIDASAFSRADVGDGPLLWFVHPEDTEGKSVGGGGPRDEVIYVYDPTGDEPPQEIWRGQNPQPEPIARLNSDQLLIEYRDRSLVLHLNTGEVAPLLSVDNQSKFLDVVDGDVFFLRRTVPYTPYGYQLGSGGPGVTVMKSYYRPRDYLYVYDLNSGGTMQLLDVALEKVISTEWDAIWAITAGSDRRLCRISMIGELEEIIEIDDHLVAPEVYHEFSPTGRYLALSYLHDEHDFHSERELIVADVEEKRVVYRHDAVAVGYPPAGFAQGSAPSLVFRWLDDTHLSYGYPNVVDAAQGNLVEEAEAERLRQRSPLRRDPPQERVGFFDREFGRLFFRGEDEPVASVLKEGSGRVSDLEVCDAGEWAAFSSPEDKNTYIIDGRNRAKALLMEGWSYNITWLPATRDTITNETQ